MRDFRTAVQFKQIAECPVTTDDIDVAQAIWGKSVAALKGKTVRKQPAPVVSNQIQIPREFMNLHKKVWLACDLMFINRSAFFVSISRKICFTGSIHITNKTHVSVLAALKATMNFYERRGFRIAFIHGDGDFESLRTQIEDLPGKPRLEVAAPGEHVHEIERRIRVIKERFRALESSMPFDHLPV